MHVGRLLLLLATASLGAASNPRLLKRDSTPQPSPPPTTIFHPDAIPHEPRQLQKRATVTVRVPERVVVYEVVTTLYSTVTTSAAFTISNNSTIWRTHTKPMSGADGTRTTVTLTTTHTVTKSPLAKRQEETPNLGAWEPDVSVTVTDPDLGVYTETLSVVGLQEVTTTIYTKTETPEAITRTRTVTATTPDLTNWTFYTWVVETVEVDQDNGIIQDKKPTHIGAIVGGVAGGLAFIALLVGIGVFFRRQHRKPRPILEAKSSSLTGSGGGGSGNYIPIAPTDSNPETAIPLTQEPEMRALMHESEPLPMADLPRGEAGSTNSRQRAEALATNIMPPPLPAGYAGGQESHNSPPPGSQYPSSQRQGTHSPEMSPAESTLLSPISPEEYRVREGGAHPAQQTPGYVLQSATASVISPVSSISARSERQASVGSVNVHGTYAVSKISTKDEGSSGTMGSRRSVSGRYGEKVVRKPAPGLGGGSVGTLEGSASSKGSMFQHHQDQLKYYQQEQEEEAKKRDITPQHTFIW